MTRWSLLTSQTRTTYDLEVTVAAADPPSVLVINAATTTRRFAMRSDGEQAYRGLDLTF
jgi:hypothetical protein